ncbi:MAG: hypothetical protein SEPTF4163_006427 [Sporothrix epigloea]
MQLTSTLLFLSAALWGYVAANPKSLGAELGFFYYVYKMECTSWIPDEERKLGRECTREKGEMCLFDEFVISILEKDAELKTYLETSAPKSFHTTTPFPKLLDIIAENTGQKDRVDLEKLSIMFPTLPNGRKYPYAKVIEDMTDTAQKVAAAGDIANADIKNVKTFADLARNVRRSAAYKWQEPVLSQALKAQGKSYLVSNPKYARFDFTATLKNVNDALSAGTIDKAQANEFKQIIEDARNDIIKSLSQIDIDHWATIKSFTTFISKASEKFAAPQPGSSTATSGGGGTCASEFGSASRATRRKRREIMERAIGLARLHMASLLSMADE